jgi:hypothetical protein
MTPVPVAVSEMRPAVDAARPLRRPRSCDRTLQAWTASVVKEWLAAARITNTPNTPRDHSTERSKPEFPIRILVP